MNIIEVRFSAKNKNCVSLKPVSFLINTNNTEIAKDVALEELKKKTEHWERYAPICLFKTVYEVDNG